MKGIPLSIKSKVFAATAVLTLVTGAGAVAASTASATTLTCTGVANQVTPPLGCGGAQLAYTAKGTLDLAVLGGNYWNSPVGFETDSVSTPAEDFTVFAVNGDVHDGPGYLGEYVAVYTPDGKFASFTQGGITYTDAVPAAGASFTVGANVYALSVEKLDNGPKGAAREWGVLRNADSNGIFTYGKTVTDDVCAATPTPPTSCSSAPSFSSGGTYINDTGNVINVTVSGDTSADVTGSGVSGSGPSWAVAPGTEFTVTFTGSPVSWTVTTDNSISASRANRYQVWAPVSVSDGLELINESLSGGFRNGGTGNTPYVLDDKGFGGTGTRALAFPENDGLNQQFSIVGCTEPVTGLNTSYALCP